MLYRQLKVQKTSVASHHSSKALVLIQPKHWLSSLTCKVKHRIMTTVPSSSAKGDRSLQGTHVPRMAWFSDYITNVLSTLENKLLVAGSKEVLPRLNIPGVQISSL